MAGFSPKAYLAGGSAPSSGFDPKAYLADDAAAAEAAAPPATQEPAGTDLGALVTGALHATRHLAYGLGDKITAGVHALYDTAHNQAKPFTLANLADQYSRDLAFNDQALESSDKLNPGARWAGNATGFLGSMLIPAGVARAGLALRGAPAALQATPTLLQLARGGAKTGAALGALGGFGGSRSDSLGGTALDTGLGAALGGGVGFAAPYVADGAARAAAWAGEGLKDAAGKLKVHSLHPVPTLGEKLAELPGGEAGAGRELLEQGIGGLTKNGTAEQIDKVAGGATKVAGNLAAAYDKSGAGPVDIAPAIFRAAARAQELQSDPLTREAGVKLEQKLMEYADKYRSGTTTAADALQLKRTLGDHVFGAKVALKNGDVLGGEYGKGLAEMQRGVDDTLDNALGPQFAEANLRVRRLMGAGAAADREAGKSNHLLGLIPTMVGLGVGGAHGAEGGAAASLAAMLLHKYGAQAGARSLYTLGQLASGLGRLPLTSAVPGLTAAAGEGVDPYADALRAFLRSRQQAPTLATLADPQSRGGR